MTIQRKAVLTWERILWGMFILLLLGLLLAVSGCAMSTRIELDSFSFHAKRLGNDDL